MRYINILPLVATATSVVIPDETTAHKLILETEQEANGLSSLLDKLPNLDELRSSAEDILDGAVKAFEYHISNPSELPETEWDTIKPVLDNFLSPSDYTNKPYVDGHGHNQGSTNLTVYESIKASNFTKKFAALIDDYPDIIEKLNSTSANVTAFVPTDRAFDKIPDHHKDHKPSREIVEKILQYHILPGSYPAGRVLAHHTLPTALEEEDLGGRAQRLRIRIGFFGIWLNFYSKLIPVNLHTKNGIAHAVDSILVPPPPAEKLISLFPSKFSTLELAAEKTGFAHHHRHNAEKLTGLTFFAPTNFAFKKLGPRANAFLFNTEKGLGYLKALLKYHAVANETLYSDEYYGKQGYQHEIGEGGESHDSHSGFEGQQSTNEHKHKPGVLQENRDSVQKIFDSVQQVKGAKHYHLDLPTLLGDKNIAVDIANWHGFIKIRLNGQVEVAVQDGLAKDGVVQVVGSVLIPPHEHKGFWQEENGHIEVEELMERLDPFVKAEEQNQEVGEL
ncbi:FAS1 domain-containing protein [Whalleya microplaca]|nr:FAS1 domain-containing protein [Whalleya microplaca]